MWVTGLAGRSNEVTKTITTQRKIEDELVTVQLQSIIVTPPGKWINNFSFYKHSKWFFIYLNIELKKVRTVSYILSWRRHSHFRGNNKRWKRASNAYLWIHSMGRKSHHKFWLAKKHNGWKQRNIDGNIWLQLFGAF